MTQFAGILLRPPAAHDFDEGTVHLGGMIRGPVLPGDVLPRDTRLADSRSDRRQGVAGLDRI